MSGALQAVFQNQRSFGAPPDAQFNYVTMLLHGDGTNGAQNNTFLDSSTNAFTITRNGNTTQGSFSPYGSNWSANFASSSTDYLSAASNAAFAFGTGDFTMEAFVFATASQTDNWIIGLANNCWFRVGSGGALEFYNSVASTSTLASTALPLNTWTHVAVVRSGTALTIYQNGVSVGSATVSTNFSSSVACTIGNQVGYDRRFNGYISNARVVKGTAVYTSAFTPSTTPLTAITNTSLLTCQSNRFIDNSSNAFTLTVSGTPSVQRFNPFGTSTAYDTSVIGGSGYFDGSNAYLNVASNAAFGFGTGDFTVEFWYYSPVTLIGRSIYHGTVNSSFIINSDNSGRIVIREYGVADLFTSSGSVITNAWNHIAVARSGTTISMWLNGSRANGVTGTNSTNFATSGVFIARADSPTTLLAGFMSDIRTVKGTAVYSPSSTTITVPTAPLTAISGTSLLANFTNGAIFDNAMMNDLETVGNAQISTSVVKYGTGSIFCSTSSDYLKPPNSYSAAVGTGDFTIEFWYYASTLLGSYQPILDTRNTSATATGFFIGLDASGKPDFYTNGADRCLNGSAISTGIWYHISVCRASGSTKLFVNGTQGGSTYTDTNNYSNQQLRIGNNFDNTIGMSGYIDDLRITKGYARYTANFSVPTAAFPNTGPV